MNNNKFYRKLIFYFLFIAIIGAILLMLPISSKGMHSTALIDALFTSISALSITGLIIFNTSTYWSLFGQIVILLLIQIGGVGMLTITSLLLTVFKKISLSNRELIMKSSGLLSARDIRKTVSRSLTYVVILELLGTVLLSSRFINYFGVRKGIYFGIFHSFSSFCNAGFDLLGDNSAFNSISFYSTDYTILITISFLIFAGGLGVIVWEDILKYKKNINKYSFHTKIVLSFSSILVILGALAFYILEKNNTLQSFSFMGKVINSLFMSVSPRTAGFNAINLYNLTEPSKLITDVLMIVGGAPGSTAGGIKVTTITVLLVNIASLIKQSDNISIFNRRFEKDALKDSSGVVSIYFILSGISIIVLSIPGKYSLDQILFEVFSALSNVGLTLGITPHLDSLSKITIIILMLIGRIGLALFSISLISGRKKTSYMSVSEKIIVG